MLVSIQEVKMLALALYQLILTFKIELSMLGIPGVCLQVSLSGSHCSYTLSRDAEMYGCTQSLKRFPSLGSIQYTC